jgi:hypothetical protein
MSLVAYAATAATLLFLAHRFVMPLSRVAAMLLFLLPFAFTGFALLTDRVYGPIDFPYATEPLKPLRERYGVSDAYNGYLSDVASQMIPWRKAVQWALSKGEWPIYNPFLLAGDNLAGSAQPAAYSPFTLIACLLPVEKSLTYSAAIAFFIAALCAFLFARELGCSELAALVNGAVFMSFGAMTFFILWPLGFSWAFLPAVLLGVRRVVRNPGVASMWLLTTAFVLLLLAGHPETAAHVVYIGLFYAVFEMALHRRNVVRAAMIGVAAGVIALAICAVYVLPIIEVAPQTAEHYYRSLLFADAPRGVSPPEVAARVAVHFFPSLHARRWLVRSVPSTPFDTAMLGSVALAAAIYGIWRARRHYTWFFTGLAIFGILANAEWPPLARLLQKLPLLDITLNERFSFAAGFALAVLAGMGAEEVLRRGRDRAFAFTCAAVLGGVLIGFRIIPYAGLVNPGHDVWDRWDAIAEIAGASIATILAFSRVPARFLAAGLVGLILLQRAVEERGFYPVWPARAAYPPVAVFEPLKRITEPFRITGGALTFMPNMSALYELEDVRGYQAMTNGRYYMTYDLWCVVQQVWFNRVNDLTRPFLSFLNVRYAVVWPRFDPPEGWRVALEADGTRLLENERVIERAFVPRSIRLGENVDRTLEQMRHATEFRTLGWIAAPDVPAHDRANGPGLLRTRRTPSGYEIDATMGGDGWIVISETAWSGWRAYIDGRRVKTQIANVAFLSVFVPVGQHRVRLTYLPRSFVIGRAISLTTLALIGIYAGVKAFSSRAP